MVNKKIKNIVIVGGGTTGWSTALFLLSNEIDRILPSTREAVNITLIASEDIDSIGVGEGTWPAYREYIGYIEKEFNVDIFNTLKSTRKKGIYYKNWYNSSTLNDNDWYHPFYNGSPTDMLSKLLDISSDPDTRATMMNMYNTDFESDSPAIHFESGKLTEILHDLAIKAGTNYINNTVIDCNLDTDGNIDSVILSDNTEVTGDLFIDCTGIHRVLLSKLEGFNFIDCSDQFLIDSALATHISTDNNPKRQYWTTATALSSGWVWNIPLQDKTGVGYVYSSKFISDEDAKKEFDNHLNMSSDYKLLKWTPGILEKSWLKNCVGIGLSSGFLEPLEATTTDLVMGQILLLENIMRVTHNKNDMIDKIRQYNSKIRRIQNDYADYIIAHYILSTRDDSEFWYYVRNELKISGSLIDILKNTKGISPAAAFNVTSWMFMFIGMNYNIGEF